MTRCGAARLSCRGVRSVVIVKGGRVGVERGFGVVMVFVGGERDRRAACWSAAAGGSVLPGAVEGRKLFGTVRWPICPFWAVPTGFEGSAREGPYIGVGLPGVAARVRGWR